MLHFEGILSCGEGGYENNWLQTIVQCLTIHCIYMYNLKWQVSLSLPCPIHLVKARNAWAKASAAATPQHPSVCLPRPQQLFTIILRKIIVNFTHIKDPEPTYFLLSLFKLCLHSPIFVRVWDEIIVLVALYILKS